MTDNPGIPLMPQRGAMRARRSGAPSGLLGACRLVAFLLLLVGAAVAAAAGPPFEDPTTASTCTTTPTRSRHPRATQLEAVLSSLKDQAGTRVVMYTQVKNSDAN